MKIRAVGAGLFHAERRTDIQTSRSSKSLFANLRTPLNQAEGKGHTLKNFHFAYRGREYLECHV